MLKHTSLMIGKSLLVGVCSLFVAIFFGVIGATIGGMMNTSIGMVNWMGYEVIGVIGFLLGHTGTLFLGQLGLIIPRAKLQRRMVITSAVASVCASAVSIIALRILSQRYAPTASNELIAEYFIGSIVLIPTIVLSAIYLILHSKELH